MRQFSRSISLGVLIGLSVWAVTVFDRADAQGPGGRPGRMAPGSSGPGPSPEMLAELLRVQIPDDPAAVVAVIGSSFVLVGDLMPRVEARVNELVSKAPTPPSEEELQYIRASIFRSLLNQSIQLKVLRESFLLSQVGTQAADKRQEAERKMRAKAIQIFQEQELPTLYKRFGVYTASEVDEKLREQGSSFESNRLDFIDQVLAHLYRSDVIPKDPPIPMVEIRNYYEDHLDDYRYPEQAKWEQLTASFSRCGSRDAAMQLITEMGREAYFGGSMQAVARAKSQEPLAAKGGVRDWTARGSLSSTILENQVFGLPVGLMSEVIEDQVGLHIVRVLDRRAAGARSISEVQEDIRSVLKEQKIEEAIRRETALMTRRVAVWSVFPDDTPGAKPLSVTQVAGNLPADVR
ncbi:MAG: peptidyl-prolyl cis-trans isomerase [Planctomycetaceae bacterium]|nr:MAG: peptidyl-prolyl cis-trans isomerase [Planctomycetaceae bacterium]